MQIADLNAKASVLADLRRTKDKLKADLDAKKRDFELSVLADVERLQGIAGKIEEVQGVILEELRKDNLTQWKTPDATISRKHQVKFNIVDRNALIADLAVRDLAKEYTYIEVKPEVKNLFDKEDLDGVEKIETDYISVIVKDPKAKK